MTGVLIKEGKLGADTHIQVNRYVKIKSKIRGDASISQGIPKTDSKPLKTRDEA